MFSKGIQEKELEMMLSKGIQEKELEMMFSKGIQEDFDVVEYVMRSVGLKT